MADTISNCSNCNSPETMVRLPSRFSLFKDEKQNKIGDFVRTAIAENQEELQQEKERLRNAVYEPNE